VTETSVVWPTSSSTTNAGPSATWSSKLATSPSARLAHLLPSGLGGRDAFGQNVATKRYEDLVVAGIIDPTKVVTVALQNAAG
jgi:chaperonin GroEL (HSP60 family)